jgi:hypothetical protein
MEETGKEAQKNSDAFQILQEEQKKKTLEWKRIQTRLIANVESTATENGRLQQEVGRRESYKALWTKGWRRRMRTTVPGGIRYIKVGTAGVSQGCMKSSSHQPGSLEECQTATG